MRLRSQRKEDKKKTHNCEEVKTEVSYVCKYYNCLPNCSQVAFIAGEMGQLWEIEMI